MAIPLKVRKRITFMFAASLVIIVTILLRLVWVQFIIGEDLRQKAFEARFRNVEVKAKRGIIYDAKGRPLAISVSSDSFYAIPAQVRKNDNAQALAQQIAAILKMDNDKVLELLTKQQAFVWIKRHVPDEQAKALKALNLQGVNSVEEPERFYPKGQLLAHVLGFAGIDNQGLGGLEITYDQVLSGVSGTLMVEYDAKGQEIPDALQKYIAPQDGNSIVLTIDETIQYIVERELDEIMRLHQPKQAGIIVMDPKTGGILAMAARPVFDPNLYQLSEPATWRNYLISDAYEPGSTFKTVVAATALDEGVVKVTDQFYDPGYIKVGKETIKCWRHGRPHGLQTFIQGVQNSCNPVFVSVALKTGKEIFYRYLNGFGFGKKTGIELPGEALGILVNKESAKDIDLATMSIGQANAVTSIQLLTAFAALANEGYLMKPQLVKEIRDKEGNVVKSFEPQPVRQVISKETARTMMNILETVVSDGTGRNAYLEGYRIGGKTGTAQKIIPGGGYSTSDYIGSFMGVAPSNDPQMVALVSVDTPQGIYYGGTVAAPAFKNIVRDTLRYLKVPAQIDPEKIDQNKAVTVSVPQLVGLGVKEALQSLEKEKLKSDIMGGGTHIKAQLPAAGSSVAIGSKVILYTSIPAQKGEPEKVTVPDFTGKTLVEVQTITKQLNLNFVIEGQGVVVRQEPEPGLEVAVGSTIVIYLEPLSAETMEVLGP